MTAAIFRYGLQWGTLNFRYDPRAVEAIKQVPGRHWDKEARVWRLPTHAMPAIKNLLEPVLDITYQQEEVDLPRAVFPPNVLSSFRPYQMQGACALTTYPGFILSFDLRTGKTVTALGAAAGLMTAGVVDAVVAFFPSSVEGEWVRQPKQWIGLEAHMFQGIKPLPREEQERLSSTGYLLLGCSYELAGRRYKDLLKILAGRRFIMIGDECLPYNTLVDTDLGRLPIGDIVRDKVSCRVRSWDPTKAMFVWRRIVRWLEKPLSRRLVRVHHEYGSFVCTEEHKIWTESGYVEARELVGGEALRAVLSRVLVSEQRSEERCTTKILRHQLCSQMAHGSAWAHGTVASLGFQIRAGKQGSQELCGSLSDVDRQSDEKPRVVSEGSCFPERKNFSGSRRERSAHEASTPVAQHVGSPDGIFDSHKARTSSLPELAARVQGGPGSAGDARSDRSRWQNAQNETVALFGQEKNAGSRISRVVRVEILERGSAAESTACGGEDLVVFDLEVEETHNFVAAGVVVSNCQNAKNRKGGRYEAVAAVAKHPGCLYRWALTGTSMRNRPADLWAIFDIVLPGSMGSFHQFAERYCDARQNEYGWDYSGSGNEQELADRLAMLSYRVTRAEAGQYLPKSERRTVLCNMSEEATKAYRLQEAMHAGAIKRALGAADPSAAGIAVLKTLAAATSAAKIPTAVERIREHLDRGVKVLVFATFHESLKGLWDVLEPETGKPPFPNAVFCAGGWMLPDRRRKVIDTWKATPGAAVLLANTLSSGIGIDLSDADVAIYLELCWVPADFIQSEGRIQDIHQGKRTSPPLYEYLLCKGTVDADMGLALLNKQNVINAVVGRDAESGGMMEALRASGAVETSALQLDREDPNAVEAALDALQKRLLGLGDEGGLAEEAHSAGSTLALATAIGDAFSEDSDSDVSEENSYE